MSCPVVDVAGAPFDRGRTHGAVARALVSKGVARWRDSLATVADGNVDAYLSRFLAETDFIAAIEALTPTLLEEVEGIASGAEIDRTTMLAYQFMDEQWCYEHRKALALLPGDVHHCSAIAMRRAGGGRIVAQNMDLPVHFDTTQVLVRSPEELLFTAAGLIVTTGMNAAGVGVCVNSIMDRPTAASGLPVAFAIRGALAQGSATDAANFIRSASHASGQNYVIADPETSFDLEAAADGVADYTPAGPILHTNHSLASGDGSEPLETYAERHRMDLSGLQNSHARREALVAALGDREEATEEDVIAGLSDLSAPVCRVKGPGSAWMTFGSVVMTLTSEPELRLAPGPPTNVAYEVHGF